MDPERPREPDDSEPEASAGGPPPEPGSNASPLTPPEPDDEVDEWGYESFPASDPPQH